LFWILSLLLVVLAVLFVLVPVIRHNTSTIQVGLTARNAANLIIFQERAKEIEQDLKEGLLDTEQYTNLKAELERTLLSDVNDETDKQDNHANGGLTLKSPVKLIPLLAVALALPLSYYLYETWGFRNDLALARIIEQSQLAGDDPVLIRDQIFELGAIVEQDPENGWALYLDRKSVV
jgi:cytochrome c-type biogenesis protein CcmH